MLCISFCQGDSEAGAFFDVAIQRDFRELDATMNLDILELEVCPELGL